MRRLLAALLILLAAVWPLPAEAQAPAGFDLCAENEHLALYINPETTEIAVYDKAADTTWFSNPPGRNMRAGVGQDVVQIRYDSPTSPDKLMDSWTHSVQLGQASVIPLPDGVRVEYLMGAEYPEGMALMPQLVKAGIFEEQILAP